MRQEFVRNGKIMTYKAPQATLLHNNLVSLCIGARFFLSEVSLRVEKNVARTLNSSPRHDTKKFIQTFFSAHKNYAQKAGFVIFLLALRFGCLGRQSGNLHNNK
jgi:hypothetical protein